MNSNLPYFRGSVVLELDENVYLTGMIYVYTLAVINYVLVNYTQWKQRNSET